MGFDNFSDLRAQFPVTESLIYLNHAAVAPLVRTAAEAMKRFAEDGMLYGSIHYDTWLDAYEGLVAGSPHYGEYARCERPVRLARGAEISCWVYLYCKDVSGLPALADGRWVPKASRACKHAAQRQKLRG